MKQSALTLDRFVTVAGALSDPNRLRAFMALSAGEVCVCRIIELVGRAPSTVSKHMAILRQAGLVQSRKHGRWIYYRRADYTGETATGRIVALVQDLLINDATIRADKKQMAAILTQDASSLCRKQRV